MMNAPTNRATSANTSRNVLKNDRFDFTVLLCSAASWLPVIDSYWEPSPARRNDAVSRSRSWVSEIPWAARTSNRSQVPCWAGALNTACAVAGVNAANVAPARALSLPPKRNTPERRNRRGGVLANAICTASPTRYPPACAVETSRATSPAVVGCRDVAPCQVGTSWSASFTRARFGYQPVPSAGAWFWMAWPLRSWTSV